MILLHKVIYKLICEGSIERMIDIDLLHRLYICYFRNTAVIETHIYLGTQSSERVYVSSLL